MDYAPCEAAWHNMEGITRAITFYNINCQYNKHFQDQVDQSQFLEIVLELIIIPGIGLWHVHGHQDSCYVWYALNFIEGISQIDREIMETLWACLNLISPAAQGMSSPHQQEYLDYQMNDSNFCKMIHMKRTLCHGFTWSALMHLREGFDADDDPDDFNLDILDDLEDDLADFTETSDVWTNTPELTIIPLPSNLRVD
ncbi:hypothetical protein BDR04DRAFT_1159336 [Suillus decipiens]|nr:hypothetical protein BDR04DRAFT_1159336 [Suillus decipiens]